MDLTGLEAFGAPLALASSLRFPPLLVSLAGFRASHTLSTRPLFRINFEASSMTRPVVLALVCVRCPLAGRPSLYRLLLYVRSCRWRTTAQAQGRVLGKRVRLYIRSETPKFWALESGYGEWEVRGALNFPSAKRLAKVP